MRELEDLKHDIERHVAICSDLATRVAELEEILTLAIQNKGDWRNKTKAALSKSGVESLLDETPK